MRLSSNALSAGRPIDPRFAFCRMDPETHAAQSDNVSPDIAWTDAPPGTQSFALICHDPDVPAYGDGVNTEGEVVEADRERADFFHWVLVDIPASVGALPEGAGSSGVTPRGKPTGRMVHGLTGRNDYTGWFADDPDMSGSYGGYDGPCPPWNDERLHHYHFTVFALDTPTLRLAEDGAFTGHEARDAMEGHVLGQAELVGTYTLNPHVA